MDDEDRPNEEAFAEAYKEWQWRMEQDMPAHKQAGYAERQYEKADDLRLLSKELMQ